MYFKQTLSAGVEVRVKEVIDFFRILEAPVASDVTVIFMSQGREVSKAEKVGQGYSERFAVPVDEIIISSTGGGVLAYVGRLGGEVRYDQIAGVVTVANQNGPIVNTAKTVTSTSTQLIAANANRRYLLVQNKDAAGVVYLSFSGAATVGNGLKIAAGGSYAADGNFCHNGAINAIGDIASNANVVVLEG